jgi:hypothetical protein
MASVQKHQVRLVPQRLDYRVVLRGGPETSESVARERRDEQALRAGLVDDEEHQWLHADRSGR